MNQSEGWGMYREIHQLKQIGLNNSQIARRLNINRNTVAKYISMTAEEFKAYLEKLESRSKKLDKAHDEILYWIREYPELSNAQVLDWLKERLKIGDVCEGTVRNYVMEIREKYNIPKSSFIRSYEAIDDPPMGHQMQVDFGEFKVKKGSGDTCKLYFIAFVLSNSRYKYVEWLDRPFLTQDVIRMHENAFQFYGGAPKEAVYDQDHLILVNENAGDLILTQEFSSYVKNRKFSVYMCKRADPESKGRIENVVGFVKKNFAPCRTFYTLEKWNEQCLEWLERTGNGKKHNVTNKIPAEIFAEERKYLTPVSTRIQIEKSLKTSISALIRKDNTIRYKSNRYTLPQGTYDGTEKYADLEATTDGVLIIYNQQTKKEITRHEISYEKGKLIKNNDHRRDMSRKINEYVEKILLFLPQTLQSRVFVDKLREHKSRYIRDQLQIVEANIKGVDNASIEKALNYCIKQKLYSAVDFSDALKHFKLLAQRDNTSAAVVASVDIKPIDAVANDTIKAKPEVRDIRVYQDILKGGKK
jgi:transposase